MKRTLALIITVMLCMTFVFSGCSTKEDYVTANDEELNNSVVATVDGEEITQADFNFVYKLMFDEMSQYAQYYGEGWLETPVDDNGTTMGQYIKDSVIAQHTQLVAILRLADEYGIDVDGISDDVKTQKEEVVKNYGGEEGYISFLETCRTTDKAIDTYIERTAIYNKVYEKLTSEGGEAYINDEEVVKEFSESYLTVKHILVSTQPGTDENGNETPAKTDAEAQVIVSEILGKIEAGAEFDSLIEEYDEDPGMEKGGFYTFTDGQMVAEFEEASKNLQIGDYTKEAVKTDYGYHIIKRYDINTEDETFAEFKKTKADTVVNDIITKRVDSLKTEKKDDVIDEYLDPWVEELKAEIEAAAAAESANVTQSVVPAE